MKILLLNDYGTPTGGAEIQMLALRDALRERGYDARFFATSADTGGGKNLADYKCFGTTSGFRTLLQTANPWAYWKLSQVLREFKPDVVHAKIFLTQLSPLILPLLKEVPSLYHVAWYRPVCPLGTKILPNGHNCEVSYGAPCYRNGCIPMRDWVPLMFQMNLWRRWRKVFNLVVANSEFVKSKLIADGIQPVEIVYYGIQEKPPRPPLSNPPTVVFAGRLVWEKGVDVLLRAFAKVIKQIPQAKLLIAGEGPERENINNLSNILGICPSVTMLGHLPHQELENTFKGAWVQVVPSRWNEPFGIVALEAMARGTAVIASSSGGLREIVRDIKTGFLVPPENVDTLAEKLLTVLSSRELAEQKGREGRRFASLHFNEANSIERFLRVYRSLHNRNQI